MDELIKSLGNKLGVPTRRSMLLDKARSLGLTKPADFEGLAVTRGCWHYRQPGSPHSLDISESQFSNEELAISLLSPLQPYSPRTIRLGAAMLGATGNSSETILDLAKAEQCEIAVRYVAKAGLQFEPDNSFWRELFQKLSATPEPPSGVFPHPTRFVSMTGFTRNGPGKVTVWIRPRADLSLTHG